MPREFTCEHCGESYLQAWSDEERQQEYEENFTPEERDHDPVTVCDDCYKVLMERYHRRKRDMRG